MILIGAGGRIHSVEALGIVDGPGLRYVIFMQGCRLRCRYCHNPDTWNMRGGKEFAAQDVVKDIARYKAYIKNSGGGITATGGEPMLQPVFLTEVFQGCRRLGIPTALDTAGSVRLTDQVKSLLDCTDLVLLDVKHLDEQQHVWLTGASSKNTIRMAYYLNERQISTVMRYLLVPGLTDDPFYLERLAAFGRRHPCIQGVEIIPYHRLGVHKWSALDLKYTLECVPLPTEEDMVAAAGIFRNNGLTPITW